MGWGALSLAIAFSGCTGRMSASGESARDCPSAIIAGEGDWEELECASLGEALLVVDRSSEERQDGACTFRESTEGALLSDELGLVRASRWCLRRHSSEETETVRVGACEYRETRREEILVVDPGCEGASVREIPLDHEVRLDEGRALETWLEPAACPSQTTIGSVTARWRDAEEREDALTEVRAEVDLGCRGER